MQTALKNFLSDYGFNLVALPKAGIEPLFLLYKNNGDLSLASKNFTSFFPALDGAPPEVVRNLEVPDIEKNSQVEYEFKTGISVLEGLLAKAKLGKLGAGVEFDHDKTVSISYEHVTSDDIDLGELDKYLNTSAPSRNKFYTFKEKLENSELYVINATLKSNSFSVTIGNNNTQDVHIDATLKAILEANAGWNRNKNNSICMRHQAESPIVFGFKAQQIIYDKKKWWQFGRSEEVIFRIKDQSNEIFKSDTGFETIPLEMENTLADI